MTNDRRIDYPGAVHHVTQRGAGRQLLFEEAEDYRQFLDSLLECLIRYQWDVLAYALMPARVDVVLCAREGNLSLGMRRLTGSYARGFNAAHGYIGSVFQGRFESRLLATDDDIRTALAAVAVEPVRRGVALSPADWPWSTHAELGGFVPVGPELNARRALELFSPRATKARHRYLELVDRMATAAG
jgi:REP element-mobilizing transposase RayT